MRRLEEIHPDTRRLEEICINTLRLEGKCPSTRHTEGICRGRRLPAGRCSQCGVYFIRKCFNDPMGGDYIVTGVRIQKKYAVGCKRATECAVVRSRALVTPTGISRVIKQQ